MQAGTPSTLGARIADCRESLGWTQKRLADAAGISVTFLSEVENDRRKPGSDVLLSLAEALGASIDYLLRGSAERSSPQPSLVIPSELAQAAEERGWSFAVASSLYKTHKLVIAARNRGAAGDDKERRLPKQEWISLHKRLFGDDPSGERSKGR